MDNLIIYEHFWFWVTYVVALIVIGEGGSHSDEIGTIHDIFTRR